MRTLSRFLVTIVVLAAVLLVGAGWHDSTQLLDPGTGGDPVRDMAVVAVTGDTVTLRPRDAPDREVRDLTGDLVVGLDTGDGFLRLSGPPVSTDGSAVERTAELVTGSFPEPGDAGLLTLDAWPDDPTLVGLDVEEVSVLGPVGDLPGWVFPGHGRAADDWVVHVHGRGGSRATALRTVGTVVGDLGRSALVITHRNDVGAPASPDGNGHVGDTEWEDLQAWLLWLERGHDVDTVTLFAAGQGASVAASCLRRCVDEVSVDAAILDSPLLSLRETLELQAADRGVPDPLIGPLLASTRVVSGLRGGPEFGNLEHVRALADLDLPILLLHGEQDETVPIGPTLDLAAADPDQVDLVTWTGGHDRGWNVDPDVYEAALTAFLTR